MPTAASHWAVVGQTLTPEGRQYILMAGGTLRPTQCGGPLFGIHRRLTFCGDLESCQRMSKRFTTNAVFAIVVFAAIITAIWRFNRSPEPETRGGLVPNRGPVGNVESKNRSIDKVPSPPDKNSEEDWMRAFGLNQSLDNCRALLELYRQKYEGAERSAKTSGLLIAFAQSGEIGDVLKLLDEAELGEGYMRGAQEALARLAVSDPERGVKWLQEHSKGPFTQLAFSGFAQKADPEKIVLMVTGANSTFSENEKGVLLLEAAKRRAPEKLGET